VVDEKEQGIIEDGGVKTKFKVRVVEEKGEAHDPHFCCCSIFN